MLAYTASWIRRGRGAAAVLCMAALAALAAPTADQRIEQALAAARGGDPRTAIPLLEQAERMHPFHQANVEVLYQLGTLYIEAGNYDAAAATFDKLLTRYGKYADRIARVDETVVSQARVMSGQKKHDEALQHVRTFMRERPRSPARDYAEYTLAYILTDKGDYAEARKLLERIAGNAQHAMREPAYFLLAEIAAKEQKYDQVEALMRRLLGGARDAESRNAALFKLADMYRNSGNTPKALDTYRRIKAQGNDPASRNLNASILIEIGETFEKLGHALEARVAFEGVATLYADSAFATDAWHRAILADADYGDVARAEESYLKFRAAYPGEPMAEDVRFYLAQKLMQRDAFDDAINQVKAGITEFPSGQWAEASFNALGLAFLGAKRFDEAERALQEFARTFPNSELVPDSFFFLAETYLEQQRYAGAIETYDKITREFPAAPVADDAAGRAQEVRLIYAEALIETNRIDDAVEQLRAVSATNLVEQAAFMIGDAYARGERFDDAERAYEEFLAQYPESTFKAQALFALADVRMRAEAYDEAEQALRQVLALQLPKTNPVMPSATLQIAFCRYYADDTDGMTNALLEVTREYPDAPEAGEALYWLGFAYRSSRAYEAAADVYRTLMTKHPAHAYAPEAAYLVGESYVLDNKAGQAAEGFIEAYKAFPQNGYALFALVRAGEVYMQLEQLPGWLARLDEIAAEAPAGAALIPWAKAGVLMRAGQGAEAAQLLGTRSVTGLPDNAAGYALALRAGVQNANGQHSTAAATASEAIARCSEAGLGLDEALFQLARALYLQKQWQAAEEVYQRLLDECVIANAEVNALALLDRAQALYELGETANVVKLCDDALRLRPRFALAARAVLLKGDAMMKRNEHQKAAQFYRRAVTLYGRMEEYAVPAYRGLIAAYTKLGLTEDAQQAQEQFAQRYPKAVQ